MGKWKKLHGQEYSHWSQIVNSLYGINVTVVSSLASLTYLVILGTT